MIARRSRRIASPPVGRGHRNGLKMEGGGGEQQRERERDVRGVDEGEEEERAMTDDGDTA